MAEAEKLLFIILLVYFTRYVHHVLIIWPIIIQAANSLL